MGDVHDSRGQDTARLGTARGPRGTALLMTAVGEGLGSPSATRASLSAGFILVGIDLNTNTNGEGQLSAAAGPNRRPAAVYLKRHCQCLFARLLAVLPPLSCLLSRLDTFYGLLPLRVFRRGLSTTRK